MKYTGESCPVCEKTFVDGDDVVVCPECGTPSHRECWKEKGHCINEEKHGNFVWTPSDKEPLPTVPIEPDSTVSKLCPHCSARNDENASVCKSCGQPLTEEEEVFKNPFTLPEAEKKSVEAEREIDGVKISKIMSFVQVNYHTYLQKFTRLSQKKLSFNWAAAIFNPYWFFFRKLYYVGGIFLGLQLLVTVLSFFLISHFGLESLLQAYAEATTIQEMQAFSLEMQPHLWKLILIAFISTIPKIIAGFVSDAIYKRNAFKKIKKIEESPEPNSVTTYVKNGAGVSIIAGGICYMAYNLLTTLLL